MSPTLAGIGTAGQVALTFDDGPHPKATPRLLEILAEHSVRATFFVLGEALARHPEIGRAIAAHGHDIAVHAWQHRCLLWTQNVYGEFARTAELIETVTEHRPRWVRPPYGIFSASSLVAARRLGLAPVLWTHWAYDWSRRATPASVTAAALRNLHRGDTILLHDSDIAATPGSWRSTLAALPELLTRCHDNALAVGPLSSHWTPPANHHSDQVTTIA